MIVQLADQNSGNPCYERTQTVKTCVAIMLAFAVCLSAELASGNDSMLVLTAEEFEANLNYRERGVDITAKPTDPLAPEIIIDRPDVAADVAPPVDVAIRFQASEDAAIDLETLKIRYGWFDITDRVLKAMDVSPDGIEGQIQSMKKGKYSLKISVRDTMRRKSDAKIVFQIVDLPGDS